jgi:hypothetical protein
MHNLLPEPPATLLPAHAEADKALAEAAGTGTDEAYAAVAARSADCVKVVLRP